MVLKQTKQQKKRLIEAKKSGKFKKAKFTDISQAIAKSDIKPKGAGQTKLQAGQAIAGKIKSQQIKKFGAEKVKRGGRTVTEVATRTK